LQDLSVKLVIKQLASDAEEMVPPKSEEICLGAEICCAMIAHHTLNKIEYQYSTETARVLEPLLKNRLEIDSSFLQGVPQDVNKVTPDQIATLTHRILDRIGESKKDLALVSTGMQFAAKVGFELVGTMLLNDGIAGALFQATGANLTGVMKLLLAGGADPNAIYRDRGGDDDWIDHTLIACAAMGGQTHILEILLSYGGDPNLPLRSYSRDSGEMEMDLAPVGMVLAWENPNMLRCLLKYGADPNRHMSGMTPLHVAATTGHMSMARVLLENGAEVSSKAGPLEFRENLNGGTALHFASAQGNEQFVELLIGYGIDLDITTDDGQTALEIAEQKGHPAIAEILKNKKDRQSSQ
jgi:ankyrin repeat protein